MTPYEIELLLHVYYRPGSITKTNLLATVIQTFVKDGVIKPCDTECGWELTKIGEACVKRLCEVKYSDIRFCSECGQYTEEYKQKIINDSKKEMGNREGRTDNRVR